MRILVIGDAVSDNGCAFLRKKLGAFKRENNIDFCIVNGENSALGNGITPASAENLFTSGADLITTGNHALRRAEIYPVLENENIPLLRPANFHRTAPGRGTYILEKGSMRLGVCNIIGTVYMDYAESPYDCLDRCIKEFEEAGVKNIVVDFHAEATAEKRVFGFYADKRVSAVVGTHTHVQTSDAQILPGGTAYITDLGMTGVINSVLGVTIEKASLKLRTGLPVKFDNPDGECMMSGAVIETDNKTGRAISIESFCVR